ncbi:hypothetical protein Q7P37_008844 [Cladosporium fusiforme]
MNNQNQNNIPIRGGNHQHPRYEPTNQALPSVHSLIHDVPQLGMTTVSRPMAFTGAFNTQAFNQGQPMPHLTGHIRPHQAPFPLSYRCLAQNSIESLPSTAVSSPRVLHSDCASSSGYESSNYAGPNSRSSMSTTARTIRPSRSKRGSESQSSSYERHTKRACSSQAGDESDISAVSSCSKKCKKSGSQCANPGDCRRKAKKTKNEKGHRKDQSGCYQIMEDALQTYCGWTAPLLQKPGNRRISGCNGNKQQTFEAYIIFNEVLFQQAQSPGLKEKVLDALEAHFADDTPKTIPRISLMATDTPTGDRSCPGIGLNQQCSLHDDQIQCRKHSRFLVACEKAQPWTMHSPEGTLYPPPVENGIVALRSNL